MSEERVEIHCNNCNGERWHRPITATITKSGDDSDGYYPPTEWWREMTDVFACCGCDEITVRRRMEGSGYRDDVAYLPPRAFHQQPQWTIHLPFATRDLLRSVYTVMSGNGSRLACMGIRTLLDDLILERVGDCGTFKEKLERMVSGGHLTPDDRRVLDAVLELGHAATHRSYKPPIEQLRDALIIVEGLLHRFYIVPKTLGKVTKGVPPKT